MGSPRVFTIPPSARFLRVLVEALIDGRLIPGFAPGRDPLALAAATLYLPTRRAVRLARDTFLDVLGVQAAILPRIVAIGDIDEDEIAFSQAARGIEALDLPPVIAPLERRLLLTQLVLKWATRITPDRAGEAPLVAATATAALELADDLARLIDDMTMRGVAWERLDGLVPDHLDRYWQLTLDFLKIAREVWPALLEERGQVEPAVHRDRLIAAEAARLAGGPVIVAGSTGSIPATAALIDAVARAPQGAVVLPGLDLHLDDESWAMIGGGDGPGRADAPACGHPQFALFGLLARLGIGRKDVTELVPPRRRERLVSEALRPAAATDQWRTRLAGSAEAMAHGMDNLTVIAAAHAEDEALAIAVVLREAAETMGKTAALVTPDRGLARRVKAQLARWHLPVDDSGGDALPDTRAGVFARLAAEAALGGLAPVPLLALLKHPLFRLGEDEGAGRTAIAALERALLRGPRPSPGTTGLTRALASLRANRAGLHRSDPRRSLDDTDLDAAAALVERLATALAPLESLPDLPTTLATYAAHHRDVVRALSQAPDGDPVAFVGVDGNELERAFEELVTTQAADQLAVRPSDYGDLFVAAISPRVVRRPGATELSIRILGPLEARLVDVDRVVLGGLVESVWPPDTQCDAWLSRPMRHQLGLDLPERRIGLSAHDFAQMLGAPEVFLSRADKVGGAPAVPSRFLQRLAAVTGKDLWGEATRKGEKYLAWARSLDRPDAVRRIAPPAPKPPHEARPRQLSVTQIEDWLRDPYSIFARHILRLYPVDPVDLPVGYRDRGNVIHEAVAEFTARFAAGLPEDPEAELIRIGEKAFAPLADYPEARAFWWPRFRRIARWFASEFEQPRRTRIATINAEIGGRITIGDFTLTSRADRIERLADGRFAILDYKTGQVPSDTQVTIGLAPQLTLEAAILRQGGFKDIAGGGSVDELTYVALKGGEPAGLERTVKFKEGDADSHADTALAKLAALVARFDDPEQPYRSLALSMWSSRYGDYDHLARVKEWSATGGEGDGGGE
jgi:ATP-dependent helicase/nuclease subunit B